MKKWMAGLIFSGLFSSVVQADDVSIRATPSEVVIENQQVEVHVSLKAGTYSAVRKTDGFECVSEASWSVEDWKSTDGYTFKWEDKKWSDPLAKGKSCY